MRGLRQPMWKINLAVCVMIVALVAGYFFSQVRTASTQFRINSREHSQVLAAAVEFTLASNGDISKGQELVTGLLDHLGGLPGIASVQLVPHDPSVHEPQAASLVEYGGRHYSETRLPLGDRDLIVTQRAEHFARRLQLMRRGFLLFAGFLVIFGVLSSWWIYHGERRRLREAREYEQQMARQHEAASLGRAAATIAHELGNPLNAIGMGLQRLQLEAADLDEEHRRLVVAMREGLLRSNTIVTSLRQYAKKLVPVMEPVDLHRLTASVLDLYDAACAAQGIVVDMVADPDCLVEADRGLAGQVMENLVKNGVEAQTRGGVLHIVLRRRSGSVTITVTSEGFTLSRQECKNIFEPYFTTKTKGTGLGLAICRRIVEAHHGNLVARPDWQGKRLTMVLTLPLTQPR